MRTFFKLLLTIGFFAAILWVGFTNKNQLLNLIKSTGLIKDTILVSGTGSMYPTFPLGTGKDTKALSKEVVANAKMFPYPLGITIFDKTFFSYQLKHGDIVSFTNDKTKEVSLKLYGEESGYIKRLIGLPGDTIEIKNGLVYLNGEPEKEAYTALPHSTFGGIQLAECKVLKIPENKIFVLGDNRKASADSRSELGLVNISEIDHVIPLSEQKGVLDKNWRDTSLDLSDQTKIKLNAAKLLSLLNTKRTEANVKNLVLQSKLNSSAELRANNIIKFNDFSFDATKSKGYTMQKAMAEVGYSNIVWGEVPVQGYYTSEELLDNLMEFPDSKAFVLNKDFSEFGISMVEGSIDNCPTQVIVLHFAGYIPPTYSNEVVSSWQKLLDGLKDIQPSWKKLKDYEDFYKEHKDEINRLNDIIGIRISNVSGIVDSMVKKLWLSNSQNSYLSQDEALGTEMADLAKKINGYVK